MKYLLNCSLLLGLLLPGVPAMAQWGNTSAREKADVLGRDLSLSAAFLDQHDGVFWEYTTGDPFDENNSILIEMLGSPTNAIVTNSVQNFIDTTGAYRGAFRTRNQILSRVQRAGIVQTMRDMETRSSPTAIGYISFPYFNQYLYWTDRNSDGRLDLEDIDNMRSDAVVEFAYTDRGFPIVGNGLVRTTIINDPFVFQYLASLTSGISQTGVLLPSDQLQMMIPATVDAPELTVYDANGAQLNSGAASSMTAITAIVTDIYSGPGRFEVWLGEPQTGSLVAVNNEDWDSITHNYTSSDSGLSGMGSLADGQYTVRAIDQAGNVQTASFQIRTEPADPERKNDEGDDYQSPGASTTSFFCKWSSPAGIKKVTFGTSVYNFTCPDNTSVTVGPFANLPAGNHTCSGETCAGVTSSTSISVNAGTYQMELSAYSDGTSTVTNTVNVDSNTIRGNAPVIRVRSACTGTFPAFDLACMYIGGTLGSDCFVINDGCQYAYRDIPGNSADVTNSTNTSPPFGLEFRSSLGGYSVSVGGLSYIATGNARVKISQAGQNYPRESPDGKFGGNLGYKGGNIGPTGFLPQWLRDILNKVKRTLDTIVESVTGSDLVFTSTGTISFTLTGVTAATDTMRIYQWTTAGWSSGTVTDQTISLSSTGVLRATGTVSTGGYFVLLYDGSDSSAPVTGFNIQGSSFVFDTTLFLSTYSYVVFVATDPAVNGFASGAATTYYRLDPDSTTAYAAYASSLPVPLGFHTIQYYSVDYAGNAEAPKISSFVVTAGSVFRASEGLRAPGGVLAGFLGSGAQVEVVSAAENDLTVRVSSQNGTPLFTVNNIGGVGMGTDLALGHVDIQGRGSSGETALLLRSGSAAGGSQVQFGYNGDVSMRHQLKTRHSTAAYGNALDFLVWNPGAGSTTTAADLGALSLEGSTLTASGALAHVHPAGQADEELVVSDGLTMGGGTIHRLAAYAPSSLRFKSSVRRLGTREEDRAFEETAALRPARFRYKGEPAGAPLRLGLIYEDAPESLRAEGKTVSVDERVANLELALKASMRRLEALQRRLRELEAP